MKGYEIPPQETPEGKKVLYHSTKKSLINLIHLQE